MGNDQVRFQKLEPTTFRYTGKENIPKNITKLICYNVNTIPNNLTEVEELYCSNCNLTTLPSAFTKLIKLHCSNNKLTSIPSTYINLKVLICSNNNITSLPNSLINLVELHCDNNVNLTSIPTTYLLLEELNFVNTGVVIIPDNLNNLKKIRYNMSKKIKTKNNPIEEIYIDNTTLLSDIPDQIILNKLFNKLNEHTIYNVDDKKIKIKFRN